MRSRFGLSILMISLMLVQSVGMVAYVPVVDASNARGGSNDDFLVVSIVVGNETVQPYSWYNPNGTEVQFALTGEEMPISILVKRSGSATTGKAAQVTFEAVHPIGYVDFSQTWETQELFGQQAQEDELFWTPPASHSEIVNDSLEGGWILRATIYHPHDNRNDNDVLDNHLPIAVDIDPMEATVSVGDTLTFLPLGDQDGDGDADERGEWTSESGGVVGEEHWRHSNSGAEYSSGRMDDRLVRGFWPTEASQTGANCGNSAQLASGAEQVYFYWYCRQIIISGDYLSLDFHVRTWGRMAAGDSVSIELWRSGGTSIRSDLADYSPSTSETTWSNITWRPDPTELGGHGYSMGMHFQSDNSFSDEGMHVDDWIVFGVEKVDNFTLDIDCDNPESGYTAVPNQQLSLHCFITNNGYKSSIVAVHSNVTNESWMNPNSPAIRIDSDNPNYHGVDVTIPAIPPGNTSEMWINLSIPKGADVQSQVWNIWWDDAKPFGSHVKGSLAIDVVVKEQFSLLLTSTSPLLAATMLPGESGSVPMRIENTGNQEATFDLTASFPDEGWSAIFVNDTGQSFLPLQLDRGESITFFTNVTSAMDSAPGEISFSVRATCIDCTDVVSGNAVIVRNINVLNYREVSLDQDQLSIVAEANGQSQSVWLHVTNHGNEDERFNLELTPSNWKMNASLSTYQTEVLEAWGGTTTVNLSFAMSLGLEPNLYSVDVDVVSENDATVHDSVTVNLDVLPTAIPWVSNEESEESHKPGQLSTKSIKFDVRNDGNEADRFNLSLDMPDGMDASFTSLNNNQTTLIEPGGSKSVTVEFTFADDMNGEFLMYLVAESVNDNSKTATGTATFRVGSQGWLGLLGPSAPIELVNPDEEVEFLLELTNKYTGIQTVEISKDGGMAANYITIEIDENDQRATLQTESPNDVHLIHVTIEASEDALINLPEESVTVSFLIWAQSSTLPNAESAEVQVTLYRMESSNDDVSSSEASGSVMIVIQWIALSLVVILLLGFLVRELMTTEEEEDDYGVYETSSSAVYGEVRAAPDMTSFGSSGSGIMPLGPDPSLVGMPSGMPPEGLPPTEPKQVVEIPMPEPEIAPEPEQPATPEVAAPPPVPDEGLPPGWSIEQWNHYGAEWLKQQGRI